MLLSVKYRAGDVVTIVLQSGQEIIARMQEQTNEGYVVNKPLALIADPSTGRVSMMPLVMSSDEDEVTILSTACLIAPTKSNKSATDAYIQSTTGLITSATAQAAPPTNVSSLFTKG